MGVFLTDLMNMMEVEILFHGRFFAGFILVFYDTFCCSEVEILKTAPAFCFEDGFRLARFDEYAWKPLEDYLKAGSSFDYDLF